MPKNGMQKFLNIIGFGDDGDDYYEEPAYAQPPRSSASEKRRSTSTGGTASRASGYSGRERAAARSAESRPLRMPGTATPLDAGVRMAVLQPQSVEDTQTVIDNLRQGKPVIVNLETLNKEAAQRLLDFISGAIYALQGEVRKVSRGIFLLAPQGVDISGNIASSFANSFRKNDTAFRR